MNISESLVRVDWDKVPHRSGYYGVDFLGHTLQPIAGIAFDPTIASFLGIVGSMVPPDIVGGTVYMRVMEANAVNAGAIHSDSGEAIRFVCAISEDEQPVQNAFLVNGTFRQPSNGKVVRFRKELHQRVPAPQGKGRRIFLSAGLYVAGQDYDLTCDALASLR